MVEQPGKSDVTFNVISARSIFSENIQIERMVDRSGQLDERNSSNAQIRFSFEEQRQMIIAEYREKVVHHELHAAHPDEERRLVQYYGDRNWNFVKFINKVLQTWKNYENSRVLLSIRSRDENSSRIRRLFWNYQAEYRICKMK